MKIKNFQLNSENLISDFHGFLVGASEDATVYYKKRKNEYIVEIEQKSKKWLELGESAKKSAILSLGSDAPKEELLRLTEKLSITKQIENILTYPNVKKRFKNGDLHIHGWYYDIETGKIDYYNAENYEFLPLKDLLENET